MMGPTGRLLGWAKEFGFTPGLQSRIAIVPEKGSEAVDPVRRRGAIATKGRQGQIAAEK